MHSVKNRGNLKNLNELVSLNNQVDELRLQDKLGKQNFHENAKKYMNQSLISRTIHQYIQKLTETLTESSIRNNQTLENLNDKLLEMMNDRVILATYSMSPLLKITNLGKSTQLKFVKCHTSNRVNDLLIHNTIPTTPYNFLLTFLDTVEEVERKGDLSKMITNKNI